jgi:Trk K+ transport system NAD-binding subunit
LSYKLALVTANTFAREIAEALKAFDKYIICVDKTPEDCQASLVSLVDKAIKAYHTRAPGLRHGIALDKQVTIILSQSDGEIPLCAIYFNLSSPYHRRQETRKARVEQEG